MCKGRSLLDDLYRELDRASIRGESTRWLKEKIEQLEGEESGKQGSTEA